MDKKELEQIKKEIDIQLATEIAKETVKEIAKIKETKTNKLFHTVAITIMGIICAICITFTSIVGIKMINFMSEFEIVAEEEKVDITSNSDSGNANSIYNNNSAGSTITTGDK